MRIFSYIVLLIIILLGITFAALNANSVTLNYYVGTRNISLSLLLVFAMGIGIILGFLTAMLSLIRLKSENIRLNHQIKQVRQEVENLRSIPIKDHH